MPAAHPIRQYCYSIYYSLLPVTRHPSLVTALKSLVTVALPAIHHSLL